jgi:serine protease Do
MKVWPRHGSDPLSCASIVRWRPLGADLSRFACLVLILFALGVRPGAAPAQERPEHHDHAINGGLRSPFVAVAEHVGPAVVSITTSKSFRHGDIGGSNPLEDMFRQFFPREQNFEDREFELPGAGSGFLVSEDGYILTNNHVIADAEEIEVKLSGHEDPYEAEIVGQDPGTDLAVIKIDAKGKLPFVDFGDSDEVRVGDWAVAIGNPLGQLEGSLTVGIISAKGRSDLRIQGGTPRYQDFIQTDAAINFGNSGGPLVNIYGEVVGVNTAINASGQNIGFAVPSNLVQKIYTQIIEKGRVSRGYLGIQMRELTPELSDGRDLDIRHGVVVEAVLDDTPAQRAGMKVGDIITEFNGEPIATDRELQFKVADAPVGSRAEVKVYREGTYETLSVELEEFPEENVLAAAAGRSDSEDREEWLGIEAASLDSPDARVRELRDTFDIREASGVLVIGVERGSPADRARLRPGDVIVEIVDSTINDMEDYVAAVERYRERSKNIAILIRRGDLTSYVTVDPRAE